MRQAKGLWAAGAAVLSLYVLSSLGAPLGAVGDDALQILLARSLRHGAYVLPSGLPAADPLPGFAALLALPAALVEPHWDLLKLLGILSAAAVLALTWRLARRFLSEGAALSVVLLTALNAVLVDRVGLVLPDLPYLALSLFVLDAAGDASSPKALAALAAAGAACSLLRPYGALLVLAAALALAADRGWRKAAAFALAALAPLAVWTLRGRLLAAGSAGYMSSLSGQASLLAQPRAFAAHAAKLLAALGGDGLLSLRGSHGLLTAAGAAAAAAAAWGAMRLLKRREDPRAFAIACYCVLMAVQHLLWIPVAPRYVLPLLPLAWILIVSGLPAVARAGNLIPKLALCAAAVLPLRQDLDAARSGLRGPVPFQPETMAWIRRTPPDARFQSLEYPAIALLGERIAIQPVAAEGYRDDWLAWTFEQGADWVLVSRTLTLDGQFRPEASRLQDTLERFALSSPYGISESLEREGVRVLHLRRPDARFHDAWESLTEARSALGLGKPVDEVRARLKEAVALEPRLAVAWAYLAALESEPRARRRLFEKAAALDPTSADFKAYRLPE